MLLKFKGHSTDMFVRLSFDKSFWIGSGLHTLCCLHTWSEEVCLDLFHFQTCTLSRGKNNSISLLKTKVTPNPGLICPVSEPAPTWNTVRATYEYLGKLVITGISALAEKGSIWNTAGHMKFKSQRWAALESLQFGKARIINKGALLSIVFRSIKSLQTWELCAFPRPLCC